MTTTGRRMTRRLLRYAINGLCLLSLLAAAAAARQPPSDVDAGRHARGRYTLLAQLAGQVSGQLTGFRAASLMEEAGNPILVTTSLIIDEPDDERQSHIRKIVFRRLQKVLREAFADLPSVAVVRSVEYAPLSEPTSNCGRCVRCGRWTTDWTKPDSFQGLPLGRVIGGGLTCDQCECHAADAPAR